MSAFRPVRSMSGLRPVRSMSGLRYGRIVSGLQVVGGLLVFFLLLRPDWLSRWVYWGVLALGAALTLGEMALDYRRRRPRRRWRDAGLVLLSLSVVWIVIMPPFFFWGVSGEKELARATLGLGVAALVACVVCLLRWRRLRAEAEMRLWKLNAEDVTCFAPVPRRKEVGDETPEMVLCDCFGICGRAGDVPAQFFVGGAVAAACGGKFPAVRPARIALGMDAQGAAYRQAQRIPWDCRVCAIPQMCRSRHPCRICRAY